MSIGKLLMLAGVILTITGFVVSYAPGLISWFGHLPGDVRIEGENKWVFIPITSMIVVSILISLAIHLFSYLK
ncbi:MAG: DUF2905 domain-containing protein [Methylicorpusculum sp.]|uniref:DUF2905 domain-containing protein n=1 Tax=Methylicorpusculum sp. TaxID=2713644 RepID=UPI00271C0837|nr:DUF2905 domain-containing protein [Methylicorpusculum sp.]MDO8939238.1 DUF2905 domain-containing protein [Methylicorpusculum sp.]MDO9239426.1 DUF2905 domain-containing protein [Methylicorpusculum sp.]MDP2179338.1 DUF2905 domain-containing protein [Methylicorpusculum sp.]MDP2201734.1 DUF2905 domain-containing protein [Methylicorpusculum sp.]MDP3528792.1 DUF2905 domain-containing protein [Methylicorpusculum sp.]